MHEMFVEMFSISQGYGFCSNELFGKVFFRVEDFHKKSPTEPQPILGEKVLVSNIKEFNRSPKAFSVERVLTPTKVIATVQSFDSVKGWGFAQCHLGKHFIHKSDFIESFIPVIGSRISFYSGMKKGRKRGCYINMGEC